MAPTASPPTGGTVDGALEVVNRARFTASEPIETPLDLQVRHLRRRGVSALRASVLAPHAFAGAPT